MDKFELWRRGAKNGLPVFFGYLAVSFTFGIAARDILSPAEAVLMSAVNFTSAGQFGALSLIAASVSFWEMAAAQLVINSRYSLMACFISQKLKSGTPFFHRFFIAMGLTDEVFGVSASVKGRLSPVYAYGVMSTALPGWVLGTFLGLISSGLMSAQVMSALGIAIYGMFIAIIFPPVREDRKLAGIIAVAMISSLMFDHIKFLERVTPGLKIIALTLVIAGAAAFLFPLERKKLSDDSCAAECEGSVG